MRLDSRTGQDLTASFPEIADALAEAIPGKSIALDGELVATEASGAPDFAALQRRLGARPTPSLQQQGPVSYVAFDLVWLDGPTIDLPYLRRRELLAELGITHPRVQVPPHHLGVDPRALLELAESHTGAGALFRGCAIP